MIQKPRSLPLYLLSLLHGRLRSRSLLTFPSHLPTSPDPSSPSLVALDPSTQASGLLQLLFFFLQEILKPLNSYLSLSAEYFMFM